MASRNSKRLATRAAEKQKRQRIILVVGSVVLLGLLVFQGPKTWAMLHPKPPADEAHARPQPGAAAAPAPAAPAVSAAMPSVPDTPQVVSGGIGIAETTSPPPADEGKLVAFDTFDTKDPFVQQVGAECGPDSTDGTTCPETAPAPQSDSTSTSTEPPAPAEPTVTTPAKPATEPKPKPHAKAKPEKPSSAQISVNGTEEQVTAKSSFPDADPTFMLVLLTRTVAKIGLVGGTYQSGSPTITLGLGKTVTLMNTADGTRYALKLVSVG